MAFGVDSVVRGSHIYKDVWSAGIDSELPCSSESAIAKLTGGMPLNYTRTLQYTKILLCTNFCCGN